MDCGKYVMIDQIVVCFLPVLNVLVMVSDAKPEQTNQS